MMGFSLVGDSFLAFGPSPVALDNWLVHGLPTVGYELIDAAALIPPGGPSSAEVLLAQSVLVTERWVAVLIPSFGHQILAVFTISANRASLFSISVSRSTWVKFNAAGAPSRISPNFRLNSAESLSGRIRVSSESHRSAITVGAPSADWLQFSQQGAHRPRR